MWYTFCAKPMILVDRIVTLRCRSPCGERGLKFVNHVILLSGCMSLPVRGAWIEIASAFPPVETAARRSPCGERGLKSVKGLVTVNGVQRRSPCGERGLKWKQQRQRWRGGVSLPVRGAWIEINLHAARRRGDHGRSPCGERGLKFVNYGLPPQRPCGSLPVRGAWIEIFFARGFFAAGFCRSPCGERGLKWFFCKLGAAGRIRRSPCGERGLKSLPRAPAHATRPSLPVRGAWIEIFLWPFSAFPGVRSLPVRGAWIEIFAEQQERKTERASLPVRGAWIEIVHNRETGKLELHVAPRAGSVD